ncbi:MAG: hypothetical protein Q3979_04065 [Actinomycetaceae bacterium]|nr:hypothetical protein [Actinomycetaceae bacterium]
MDVFKDEGRPIPLTQERLVLRPKLTSYGLGLWVAVWLSLGSLYTGVGLIIYEPDQIGYILLALVVGVALLALVVLTFFNRTVLDADGVHLHAYGRSRDVPWPTSRTSLFARVTFGKHLKSVDVHMVLPDGTAMPLLGLSWTGQWPPPLEAAAVIQCSRIWSWAVARGYTRETHEYIPLSGATWKVQQGLRESQERRFGLRWTA